MPVISRNELDATAPLTVGMRPGHAWLALAISGSSTLIGCDGSNSAANDGTLPGSGGQSASAGGEPASSGSGGALSAAGGASATNGGRSSGGMPSSGGVNGSNRAGTTGMDAGAPASDGGPRPDGGPSGTPDAAAGASYVCSLILGIATTNEWFGGFEKVVDDARWELKFQDSAHIEKWADPAHAVWSLPTTSACARNADAPDRIVFMGVNYDYATVDLFLPKYVAVLNNIKTKYPTVKRVDVMTYTRGPGNVECVGADRSNDSYIKPAQDEAIAMFAATYPGFVFPAPKWEVASCADFTLCPHLTGAANAVISKTIGAYFSTH
jgi:hypothetical protein